MNKKIQAVAIPLAVLNSASYQNASAHAKVLLIDVAAQYDGNNNGCLISTWSFLKGTWRSPVTAYKARMELLKLGLLIEATKGGAHKPQKLLLPKEWEVAFRRYKF